MCMFTYLISTQAHCGMQQHRPLASKCAQCPRSQCRCPRAHAEPHAQRPCTYYPIDVHCARALSRTACLHFSGGLPAQHGRGRARARANGRAYSRPIAGTPGPCAGAEIRPVNKASPGHARTDAHLGLPVRAPAVGAAAVQPRLLL